MSKSFSENFYVKKKLLLCFFSYSLFNILACTNDCQSSFYSFFCVHSYIVKVLNLNIILLCTHLYHFFPVPSYYQQCIHCVDSRQLCLMLVGCCEYMTEYLIGNNQRLIYWQPCHILKQLNATPGKQIK